MNRNRPKNLDLATIKLPVMGLASILHRISAVVIWVGLFYFLPTLYVSLSNAQGLQNVQAMLSNNIIAQFFAWGFLTALGYYVCGGLKHIIQEFGFFETLEGGRLISQVALGLGIVLSILTAFWVWG